MTIFIITHGDLDGFVSAILLLKSIPFQAFKVRIANGRTLGADLRALVPLIKSRSAIFIADIPLYREQADGVADTFKELVGKGATIHLYDHHRGWDETPRIRPLCATYWVDTKKPTAAALIWRDRCRGITSSQEWMQLLTEKPGSKDPVIADRVGLLSALMQPQNIQHAEAVLKALASGSELPPEYRELSRRYYAEHDDSGK
jgi:oligoribonuclease NrnB/cAMP/cGMP phosphodiesterase (DHH superfamily)